MDQPQGHSQPEHSGTTLHDALAVIRRRKQVVLLCLIVVPAAALFVSLLQKPVYQGQADVLLSQRNLANSLTGTQDPSNQAQNAERVAQTQAELAASPTVARNTLRELGITDITPTELLEDTDISSSQNSDILVFKVANGDRALAGRLTNEYAQQYTLYRTKIDTAAINRAIDEVDRRILGTSGSLRTTLIDKREQLRTLQALQTSNSFVVRREARAEQIKPTPIRNVVLGVILGLMLGVGLAFAFDALDTRLRSAEEIAAAISAPLLVRIPFEGKRRSSVLPLMIAEPASPDSEAYRVLRSNIEFSTLGQSAKVLLFTSAIENEGKSTTVSNLAVACARTGKRVALVDLDLRRPSMERTFDQLPRPGITNVALGETTLDEALHHYELDSPNGGNGSTGDHAAGGGLWLLSSGAIPPDPGEFANTAAVSKILGELGEKFDIVLIDSPPMLRVGDPMALAKNVDGIVIVGRQGALHSGTAKELHRLLGAAPAKVLGVVVVTDAKNSSGFGYGYGYGYGYGSEQSASASVTTETPT